MAFSAVIVAGGSGARFGLKKQFLDLLGIPVLKRTVSCFDNHAAVDKLFVVVPEEDMPRMILDFLSFSLPLLIGFLATLGLVGGLGLLQFVSWARYLVIVVAIIGLLNIPIGTLKGVYSLWVLFQDETIRLFDKK
jgi:hypothetical protein